MSNLLASLEIGRKALNASRMALDVAGNNIANVNTPGFVRRRVELEEAAANPVGRFFVGSGVLTGRISRVLDGLLVAQARGEETTFGRDRAAADGLDQLESLLGESDGAGISSALGQLYTSFSRLAGAPEDAALRRDVVSRADTAARTIRERAEGLARFRADTDAAIGTDLRRVGQLAHEIADLNRQIQSQEPGAGEAAGLRDVRSLRLRELAGLVDIQVADGTNGAVYVSFAGTGDALVLEAKAVDPTITRDAQGFARVGVVRAGVVVDVTDRLRGGKIGGLLRVRDEQAVENADALDRLASDLVARVNTAHRAGFDATGAAGGDLFVPTTPGSSAAATLAVSPGLLSDPRKIAAGAGTAPGDGANALALAALEREASAGLDGRTSTAYLADLQTRVGLAAGSARSALATSLAALTAADERLQSLSGVDLDEEAVAMLQYQRSYEAAARFLSVVNEMTKSVLEAIAP